jgi:6-bladed beta-propeller
VAEANNDVSFGRGQIAIYRDNSVFSSTSYDSVYRIHHGKTLWCTDGFTRSEGLALTHDNYLVVCDAHAPRIKILDPSDGSVVRSFGRRGKGAGRFGKPVSVVSDIKGNIAILDSTLKRVQIFSTRGKYLYQLGHGSVPADKKLARPTHLVYDMQRMRYIIYDESDNSAHVYGQNGYFFAKWSFQNPGRRIVLGNGSLLAVCRSKLVFEVYDSNGDYRSSHRAQPERSFSVPLASRITCATVNMAGDIVLNLQYGHGATIRAV